METLLEQNARSRDASAEVAMRPVFFMHIAKTAGSYLNARFADAVGSDATIMHMENTVGDTAALKERLAGGVQFFSGHVMYELWRVIAGELNEAFCKIALLRDPIEHLASHIQWLDHYNRPEYAREYRLLDESHRRVVDRIGSVDITEAGQLDLFLSDLNGIASRLFDNCQSRYFIANGRHTYDSVRPLTLVDRFAVASAVAEFDDVVMQSDMRAAVGRLASVTGVNLAYSEDRVNPARTDRRIDTTNPIIRQVLTRRTILDQWLVRHVHAARSLDA